MRENNELTREPSCNEDAASAFTRIYNKYKRQTFDTAYRICKCKSTSEEVVQEVFIKLWINKETIRDLKDPEAFLFITARNLTVDYLRRKKLEEAVFDEYSFIQAKNMYVEESMTREVQRVMQEAVERLHPQQKRIYQLKKFYGWRRDKIAETLNISENTVKATMQKALFSVKKYVKERVA